MTGIITLKRIVLTLFALLFLLLGAAIFHSCKLEWQGAYVVRSSVMMHCSIGMYVYEHEGRLPDSPEDLHEEGLISITDDGCWLIDSGTGSPEKWDPYPFHFAWGENVDKDGYIKGTNFDIIQPRDANAQDWMIDAGRMMSQSVGSVMAWDRN